MSGARGRLLVVAGHDPTGGAGVDADREAARHFGVETTCVVTANTRQDGRHVQAVGARPAADWLREARAALGEAGTGPADRDGGSGAVAALKAGLLPGADHVAAFATLVRALAAAGGRPPVVVDPVLAASGGETFLDAAGRRALLAELLPLGVILTPNVPEAALLTGRDPLVLAARPRERVAAAAELLERGAAAVVVKGGHGEEDPVRDLLLAREHGFPVWLERGRVRRRPSSGAGPPASAGLHGSGCRFASALAAGLVRGRGLSRAVAEAGAWLAACLASN